MSSLVIIYHNIPTLQVSDIRNVIIHKGILELVQSSLIKIHIYIPLSMERVFAALIFAALLFVARVNNSSADHPFP